MKKRRKKIRKIMFCCVRPTGGLIAEPYRTKRWAMRQAKYWSRYIFDGKPCRVVKVEIREV